MDDFRLAEMIEAADGHTTNPLNKVPGRARRLLVALKAYIEERWPPTEFFE